MLLKLLNRPKLQSEQEEALDNENEPGSQSIQTEAWFREYFPAKQVEQFVEAMELENEPAEQMRQTEEFEFLAYHPGLHAVQKVDPTWEAIRPGEQNIHWENPEEFEKKPLLQSSHRLKPLDAAYFPP